MNVTLSRCGCQACRTRVGSSLCCRKFAVFRNFWNHVVSVANRLICNLQVSEVANGWCRLIQEHYGCTVVAAAIWARLERVFQKKLRLNSLLLHLAVECNLTKLLG